MGDQPWVWFIAGAGAVLAALAVLRLLRTPFGDRPPGEDEYTRGMGASRYGSEFASGNMGQNEIPYGIAGRPMPDDLSHDGRL